MTSDTELKSAEAMEAAPPQTTARDFWSVILNALIMIVNINHAVKVRERSLTTCTGDFMFYTVCGQDSGSLAFFFYCFKNLKVMLDENLKILDGLTLGRSWLNIQPPGFSSQKLSLQIKTLSLSLIVPAAVKLVSVAM